jgi:predicted phage-related endonuclease
MKPLTVRRRPITSREEWLSWRKRDITASRIGALFNCHPYETALRLYVEQRGVEFERQENSAMRRGRWLEPAVAKAVAELRTEWIIEPANVYLDVTELRLGATPDFYIHGDARGIGVLQAKTVAPSVFDREWDQGREVPFWIVLQTLTEAMLANAEFAAIACLTVDPHNMDCTILEILRNESAERRIREAVKQFWLDVEQGNEPSPDYSRDAAVIAAMVPRSRQGSVADFAGNNEIPTLCARYEDLGDRIRLAEAEKETIATEIKFRMGDAEVATGIPDFHVTYKTTERKAYTVAAKTFRSLRIYDRRKAE